MNTLNRMLAAGLAAAVLSVPAAAVDMGDMMNPSKWMGGNDSERRGEGPPHGYPGGYGPGYGGPQEGGYGPGYGPPQGGYGNGPMTGVGPAPGMSQQGARAQGTPMQQGTPAQGMPVQQGGATQGPPMPQMAPGGGYGPAPAPGYGQGAGPGYGQGYGPGYGPDYGYGPGYGPEPGYGSAYGPDYGRGYDDRDGDRGGMNPMKMMPNPMKMFGGNKD